MKLLIEREVLGMAKVAKQAETAIFRNMLSPSAGNINFPAPVFTIFAPETSKPENMKPIRIILLVLATLIVTTSHAQFGTLVMFAPKGEKFTLYLSSGKQNDTPAARVECDRPSGPSFKARVVFEDSSIPEINKSVFNKPGSMLYCKVGQNAKGVYVLETTSSEWSDVETEAKPAKQPEKAETAPKSAPPVGDKGKICSNPMNDVDFTVALAAVSSQPFEGSKLSSAKKMVQSHCLMCSQIKQTMYIFDLESSRMSLAKFAYDFVYDPENYSEVREELHSEKSKDDLDRYISGKK